MIFDTHAHYDDRQFEEDREELLDSMRENGVELIVDAASDIASWDKIEQLTDRFPGLLFWRGHNDKGIYGQ